MSACVSFGSGVELHSWHSGERYRGGRASGWCFNLIGKRGRRGLLHLKIKKCLNTVSPFRSLFPAYRRRATAAGFRENPGKFENIKRRKKKTWAQGSSTGERPHTTAQPPRSCRGVRLERVQAALTSLSALLCHGSPPPTHPPSLHPPPPLPPTAG